MSDLVLSDTALMTGGGLGESNDADAVLQADPVNEHVPHAWVKVVRQRVKAGRRYQDAVREVLAANAELLVLARKQGQKRRR
jgi:hypothetical protein